MSKIQEEIEVSLKIVVETMKQFYNQTKGESIQYKKGDKVQLKATNITTKYFIKKLNNKYLKFFKILKKIKKLAYYLKLLSQQKIYNIFKKVLLFPYHSLQFEL